MTDAELIAASRAGSFDAFETLVRRHQTLVSATAYAATADRAASEDVAQETFVVAWTRLAELRDPGKLRPWLRGIARNLGTKARRRRRREVLSDPVDLGWSEGLAPADTPLDRVLSRERAEALDRALRAVPETCRVALILVYREGQAVAEVAETLGLSVSAVQQRLSRGRRRLRSSVERVQRDIARLGPSRVAGATVIAALAAAPRPSSAAAIGKGALVMNGFLKAAAVVVAASLLLLGQEAASRRPAADPDPSTADAMSTAPSPSLTSSKSVAVGARARDRGELDRAVVAPIRDWQARRLSRGPRPSPPSARLDSPRAFKLAFLEQLSAAEPIWQLCVEERPTPVADGVVALRFIVAGDPAIIESAWSDHEGTTIADPELVDCFRRSLEALSFSGLAPELPAIAAGFHLRIDRGVVAGSEAREFSLLSD